MPRPVELLIGYVRKPAGIGGREIQLLESCEPYRPGDLRSVAVQDGAALDYRLVEEPPGRRHAHQSADLPAASGFPEDGDIVGIAPEGFDVVPDPFEREHYVEHPYIAGQAVFIAAGRKVQESEHVEPVVHADEHYVLAGYAAAAVVGVRIAGSGGESASVQPYHHGLPALSAGGPDIEPGGSVLRQAYRVGIEAAVLQGRVREARALEHSVPRFGLLRRHEPLEPGVGDVGERNGPAVVPAPYRAVFDGHGVFVAGFGRRTGRAKAESQGEEKNLFHHQKPWRLISQLHHQITA